MHQILSDPIDVHVTFQGNKPQPSHVRWDGRIYNMKTVNLIHSTKEGEKRIFYFSVSDHANFMKLRFDTETLEWRLVEIYTD